MQRQLQILLLFLGTFTLQAQQATDSLGGHQFNQTYLKHLIKVGIDSVRIAHACDPLVNDSILYLAATYHSGYMKGKGRISHDEPDRKQRKTPQLRAKYFGAKNYFVGENVLYTHYNDVVKGKKGKLKYNYTYKALAHNIVVAWVNSPGHFKNIISCDYQVTGLSFSIDTTKQKIYVCQKFARVKGRYRFRESAELFPYSNYEAPALINSFEGMPHELQEHEHQWDLKHNEQRKCEHCLELLSYPYSFTLSVKNDFFVLKVDNADFVKQLLKSPNDGFAVEIVTFDDYECGNPEYYTKASRRNKQCLINGKLLKPVYKEALYKGFKKRKKKKDVRFVSYLFGADSIPFLDRFKHYKFEKYSSKYFEIRLGRVPKNIGNYWSKNLVYIQDGEICYTDFLNSYCGTVYSDRSEIEKIFPAPKVFSYSFTEQKKQLNFSVPFEKNKYQYKEKDISPFTSVMENLSYTIDSISLIAYASVEGNSEDNQTLQRQRAESILRVLKKHQQEETPAYINSQTSWVDFLDLCKKNPRLRSLKKLSQEDLKNYVNSHAEALEPILKKQRRADIEMHCTINNELKNLAYLIKTEYGMLEDSLAIASEESKGIWLQKMDSLYQFCYTKVRMKQVDVDVLIELEMPEAFYLNDAFSQHFLMYAYLYEKDFREKMKLDDLYYQSEMEKIDKASAIHDPYFAYNFMHLKSKQLIHSGLSKQADVQKMFDELEQMKSNYINFPDIASQIDRINYNLNFLLLDDIFVKKRKENSIDAVKSIKQIKEFYAKNGKLTAEKIHGLAKTAVYYNDIRFAIKLMEPFLDDDDVMAFHLLIMYQHPGDYGGNAYVEMLLDAKEKMSIENWCGMFLSDCGIPFQIFDSEKIHLPYCEECQEIESNNKMK